MVDERLVWQRVADDIREGIRTGRYPVGTLVPSVRTLMAQHDASDNSVTRALKGLAAEGLVHGEPGIGTRVVGEPGDPALTPMQLLELRVAELERQMSAIQEGSDAEQQQHPDGPDTGTTL